MEELEKEKQELRSSVAAGQKQNQDLREEHQALLDWRREKESLINDTEAVQKDLKDRTMSLEKSLVSANEATEQMKVSYTLY